MRPSRTGATLIELSITLVVTGIAAGITVPRVRQTVDRLALRAAAHDVRLAFAVARDQAIRRGDYVSVVTDAAGTVRVVSNGDVLFARAVGTNRGATVTATRDSVTYAPTGLGWGAANTTVVIRRAARADTIVVSRLGRVR